MEDTILPSSVYERLLDSLKDHPPGTPRNAETDLVARTIAAGGDLTVAQKLSNLGAANDPASLPLLAHFGNLSQFSRNLNSTNEYRTTLKTFQLVPFPEKGFNWAFDLFLRDMPIRPTAHHWRLAVLFYLNLNLCAPHVYSVKRLLDILLLPVSQGVTVPRSTFHLILNHIALEQPATIQIQHSENEPLKRDKKHELFGKLKMMSYFIHDMKSEFGYEYIKDEEVYLALYKACCRPMPTITELINDIDKPLESQSLEYYRWFVKFYSEQHIQMPPELYILELLSFAHMYKWRSFMKRWKWLLSAGVNRDADLWTLFWGCLARGRNESFIRVGLRDMYLEMMDEGDNLVINRNIGIALLKCVDIVDPKGLEFTSQRRAAMRMIERL